ncbi:hypothetical protein, partial [Endozoicomonas acroporae]|uniref:hypothetical protein n=1 Tax=Endozoicomonas acroporae TaxID=1701104 RepID=UPI001C608D54
SLTDYRHPSFWDIVANCLGIFMYWLFIPAFKRTPVLRVRWAFKETRPGDHRGKDFFLSFSKY